MRSVLFFPYMLARQMLDVERDELYLSGEIRDFLFHLFLIRQRIG